LDFSFEVKWLGMTSTLVVALTPQKELFAWGTKGSQILAAPALIL